MANQKVLTVKFEAQSQAFENSIKSLQAEMSKLENSISQLVNKTKGNTKSNNDNAKSLSLMQDKARLVTKEVIDLGKSIKFNNANMKKLGISQKTLMMAFEGNAQAAGLLKRAIRQADLSQIQFTKNSNSTNSALFKMNHSARNTSGSFSVLRSQMLLASFATALVVKPLIDLAKSAGDVDEIMSKANVVFGENMSIVEQWGSALAGSLGRVGSELIDMASSLQDTFVPLGFARDAATKLSTSLVALALDVASFSNKMDADVVRDFQSAVVGNHETVKKYGIIINEASLKQEAFLLGISDGNRALTESEKVQARVSLIQKGSTDAMGDAAKTADSFNNTLKQFAAFWKVAGQEIGEALKPIIIFGARLAMDKDVLRTFGKALFVVAGYFAAVRVQAFMASVSLKQFKRAMLRTGIGAIVVGLGWLIDKFAGAGEAVNDFEAELEEAKKEMDAWVIETEEAVKANRKLETSVEDSVYALEQQLMQLQFQDAEFQHFLKVGMRPLVEEEKELLKAIEQTKQAQKDRARALSLTSSALETNTSGLKENISFLKERQNELLRGLDEEKRATLQWFRDIVKEQLALGGAFEDMGFFTFADVEEILNLDQAIKNLESSLQNIKELNAFRGQNIALKESISIFQLNNKIGKDTVDVNGKIIQSKKKSGSLDEKLAIIQMKKNNLSNAQITNDLTQMQINTQLNLLAKEELEIQEALTMQKIDNSFAIANAVVSVADAYAQLQQQQLNQAKQEEITAAQSIRNEILKNKRISEINEKYAREQEKLNKKTRANKRAQTVINTAVAIMEVFADSTLKMPGKIAMYSLVSALGLAQLKAIDGQKYQYGGLVGGRRHSQGGTMIEAERGEYVMSRDATEAIGIENLNRMNTGAGGGESNTIIINNPILGKDMIEDEIVPQIQEALRRGGSI